MAGLEVESIESRSEGISQIIVGEIRAVDPHPNANKLTVCRVFNGREEIQVVCGAPNVRPGQKIAFAPEGATVPNNQHDPAGGPLQIGRVLLRGVESAGMICSGFELGLSDDRAGIMVLDPALMTGMPLAKALGLEDTTIEIGVTANRPDLLSHIGVAREIAAGTGQALRFPSLKIRESSKSAKSVLKVRIEDLVNCPRYTARVVEGISVQPSPDWLRDALLSVGLRPVNNVVDVTNYVLMECGQPLHAFDYDRIAGKTIIVRGGAPGSNFTTLDGRDRSLQSDTLMICDGEKPVAIAGVMGGQNSEISEATTTVVLESAYFTPAGIRRTSKRLGISTEASQRFERGADPNITKWAVDRAAALLVEVAGGTVLKGTVDLYPRKIREKKVSFDSRNCNRLLGVTLSNKQISILFNNIGVRRLPSAGKKGTFYSIPTWRPDITREVDLIEEAARLYGYDNIQTSARVGLALRDQPIERDLSDVVREYLSSAGFREIVTNSMALKDDAMVTGEHPVLIANPLSKEMAALRSSLLPGMLTTMKHNLFHGIESSRFYELGTVFSREEDQDPETLRGYREEERLCIATFGLESPIFWGEKTKNTTIFDLKGESDALFRRIFLDNPRYIPYPTPTALSERPISIELKGEKVGTFGLVSSSLCKRYEIDAEVFFLDVSLDVIRRIGATELRYRQYSRFPVVRRDLAIIVNQRVTIGEIEGVIRKAAGPMLREIVLFDVYSGEQVGEGMKSCAFSLEFVPGDRTLEQQEILDLVGGITAALKSSLGAVLRQ